ncbi:beta-ketoacyl-ACP synthase [Anaeromyxobacter oryzisoli]|uniref:beta-ketoacyl-ACP synthase n=1 Tax=Anaeromyxobacter oryzisoli TaxID=2925408 RepID=UPI001F5A6BB2|nr:beta-ketoacyl-ACP synthase [Anaeromyxobacter sp. SG63]
MAVSVGNALGGCTADVVAALEAGRSGLRPCALDVPREMVCGAFAGEPAPLPAALASHDSRVSRIAAQVLAGVSRELERAVRRWGPERVALVVGTSTGGVAESERAHAAHRRTGRLPARFDFDRQHAFHGLLDVVRALTGARGPAYVVSAACASSGKVLGSARRLIAGGVADAVVAGGVDTLCQTTLRGFSSLEALSRTACRPFSAARDGTSIGEGAAFLLLEREGEAPVRLLGVGETSDAHHMTQPDPEGRGAARAMREALEQGGVAPEEVDHVNAHGTATPANDAAESSAIVGLLGTSPLVSSTKGYTGHLLGAAGATEAVFAALALERGFVPASLGAEPLDPAVRANVAVRARSGRLRTALSNSFAFGGVNVSVLLGAAP